MYESTVFLDNSNEEVLMWVILFIMYPWFKLLSMCKIKSIASYGAKSVAEYKYDV